MTKARNTAGMTARHADRLHMAILPERLVSKDEDGTREWTLDRASLKSIGRRLQSIHIVTHR